MKGLLFCFAFLLISSTTVFSQFTQTPTSFKSSTYFSETKPESKKFQIFKKLKKQETEEVIMATSTENEIVEISSEAAKNERVRTVVAKRFKREKLLSNISIIITTALVSTFLK
jgi:hypothetical protein